MAATTARTKDEVNNMSKAERLWDSLNYSYGVRGDKIDKEYNKAYSQADRQALSRGMQRSTYNNQVLGNINQNRIDALKDNESALIADYENRLGDIEQQELENERWEKQFAEGQRQYDTSLAWQKEQAETANNQWNLTFDYQKQRDAAADDQFKQQLAENQRQYDTSLAWQKEQAQTANDQWNQTFNYQKERDAAADNQFNLQFEYGKERDAISDSQWEKQFGANQDQNDRALASSYVEAILANGQMPSDELLARAGISRADAERLMAQAASGSGNGGLTKQQKEELAAKTRQDILDRVNKPPVTEESFNDALYGNGNTGGTTGFFDDMDNRMENIFKPKKG